MDDRVRAKRKERKRRRRVHQGERDRHRWVYLGTHVPSHAHTLLKRGPDPRGLSQGGVCTKGSWPTREKEGGRRKEAPWTSGKSCDLIELQELSPKAVWGWRTGWWGHGSVNGRKIDMDVEMGMSQVTSGFIGNAPKFGLYKHWSHDLIGETPLVLGGK